MIFREFVKCSGINRYGNNHDDYYVRHLWIERQISESICNIINCVVFSRTKISILHREGIHGNHTNTNVICPNFTNNIYILIDSHILLYIVINYCTIHISNVIKAWMVYTHAYNNKYCYLKKKKEINW